MGTVWIPEAEQLHPVGSAGTMLGGPARVVWHTTEAPSGKTAAGRDYFDVMDRVLTGKQAEPHILYDPLTDRLGQYFPLNKSSRALRNDEATGTSTNKTGTACIQIEVVAYASKPFTGYWKPGPNFAALMAAIRSWGIPDVWPAGRLSKAGESVSRDLTTWKTKAGHYGHCHVPGNTHWDCGAIDQQALLSKVSPTATTEEDDMNADDRAFITSELGRTRNLLASWIKGQVGTVAGQVAGLEEAVKQLSAGQGTAIDLDAIRAAARGGVSDALGNIEADVTVHLDSPA